MITALLLATAPVPTAVDAERAFAADAQRIGVWTAFRKYALPDGVMFTPQAVFAQEYLKDRKDPPKSFDWWPTKSFVSCDGRTAINIGDAITAEGKPMSHFTTVWQRDGRQWQWSYDGGLPIAKGEKLSRKGVRPAVVRAKCKPAPGAPVMPPPPLSDAQAKRTPNDSGRGESADRTLGWDWKVDKNGSRLFRAYLWNGKRYVEALSQRIPAQ